MGKTWKAAMLSRDLMGKVMVSTMDPRRSKSPPLCSGCCRGWGNPQWRPERQTSIQLIFGPFGSRRLEFDESGWILMQLDGFVKRTFFELFV